MDRNRGTGTRLVGVGFILLFGAVLIGGTILLFLWFS
jgi:hypothetical protein